MTEFQTVYTKPKVDPVAATRVLWSRTLSLFGDELITNIIDPPTRLKGLRERTAHA